MCKSRWGYQSWPARLGSRMPVFQAGKVGASPTRATRITILFREAPGDPAGKHIRRLRVMRPESRGRGFRKGGPYETGRQTHLPPKLKWMSTRFLPGELGVRLPSVAPRIIRERSSTEEDLFLKQGMRVQLPPLPPNSIAPWRNSRRGGFKTRCLRTCRCDSCRGDQNSGECRNSRRAPFKTGRRKA